LDPWIQGASFPAATAGVLVDPSGYLKVHAYWDGTSACTPNIGYGGVSMWTSAGPGDVTSAFSQEWAEPPTSAGNTVATGRTGGGIDGYGNVILAEGVADKEWAWSKGAGGTSWTKTAMVSGLDGFYAYPFVLPLPSFWSAFAVRDDQYDTTLFVYPTASWTWTGTNVADQRGQSPKCPVQQSDVFEDSSGRVNLLYRYCDGGGTLHYDLLASPSSQGPFDPATFQIIDSDSSPLVATFTYVRLVEITGALYLITATTANGGPSLFFRKVGAGNSTPPNYGWSSIHIPDDVATGSAFGGVYPYVSAPRAGGDRTPQYVDLLAVDGAGDANGLAVYARIATAEIVGP